MMGGGSEKYKGLACNDTLYFVYDAKDPTPGLMHAGTCPTTELHVPSLFTTGFEDGRRKSQ
jgi:hypothetical protein